MTDYIAYYRVSTQQQGASGLGLEAQKDVVRRQVGAGALLAEFVEVESGKRHTNRPQLAVALAECKRRKAVLVIAKLDRLARNVAFIASLMEGDVEFVACDNPHANRLMLHLLAAFAEHEREQISARTKAALACAKARGVRLGNPQPLEALKLANAAIRAQQAPPEVVSLIETLGAQGKGYRAITRELNRLNIRTGRGCEWYPMTVGAVLLRSAREAQTGAQAAA